MELWIHHYAPKKRKRAAAQQLNAADEVDDVK